VSRGHVAGDQGDGHEQEGDAGQDGHTVGLHAGEERPDESGDAERAEQAEALTLQRQGGKETLKIPRGAITTIETSWRRSRKGKGAVIGALVGLGTGVALGLAIGEDCGDTIPEFQAIISSLCLSKGEAAGVLALVAVAAGALLGLAVAPGEKWHPSSLDRLSVRITPARSGAGLTVALRF
jgi:hypothetical protein